MSKASSKIWKPEKKKKDDPDTSFSEIKNQQMVKTTHRKESEVPNRVGLYTVHTR